MLKIEKKCLIQNIYVDFSVSTFKTHVSKFTIGKEQDDKTADGRDVKSLYTLENDHLIQVEKSNSGGKDSHIDRYIDGGKLVIICECNGVKSTRVYTKA
ncbi:hypothetical protein WR25_15922 isoform B [Diploscapter pachys]|uniref:Lipocalin/cytosolic fatty-acid binding domain-containing protein n=1 Tax=Diploscapter pachys TaxID=2018661 RepID=A0A2A2JMB6_9BILA|nr:hypothetical protein WR25_15922 isoform B [Diploscapter pachys]